MGKSIKRNNSLASVLVCIALLAGLVYASFPVFWMFFLFAKIEYGNLLTSSQIIAESVYLKCIQSYFFKFYQTQIFF